MPKRQLLQEALAFGRMKEDSIEYMEWMLNFLYKKWADATNKFRYFIGIRLEEETTRFQKYL